MKSAKAKRILDAPSLEKCPTGVAGLDEITNGGFPRGRPTLLCGTAGSGKTLLAAEFLVRGVTQYDEPGVFIAFEETCEELTKNVASLGFDLDALVRRKKLVIDYVHIDRTEIEETGEYNLEGLFVRVGYAIDSVGAKRIVLDTIEALFAGLANASILRAELRRLFRWLKDKGITAVVTAERSESTLTRHGIEEYVSDCVILLDQRIIEQVATRRLRVIKYRGSSHGMNEYPFLIDEDGFSLLPVTSLGLEHAASTERVPTGIAQLDDMLGGKGYYRGSTVLASGPAGTGKTSIIAHFVDAACRRGERCLYFAFEESTNQIIRNMRSIGLNLKQWADRGLLRFSVARSTMLGLEMHLATMHKRINDFEPRVVIVDPISDFDSVGSTTDTKAMLTRLVDFLKGQQITALFTSLTMDLGESTGIGAVGISSLIDTWLLLRNYELLGERNRGLQILKSRGMAHSNQVREFLFSDHGVKLVDVYLGPNGIVTGTRRLMREAQDRAQKSLQTEEGRRKRTGLAQKRRLLDARIAAMRAEFEAEAREAAAGSEQDALTQRNLTLRRERPG